MGTTSSRIVILFLFGSAPISRLETSIRIRGWRLISIYNLKKETSRNGIQRLKQIEDASKDIYNPYINRGGGTLVEEMNQFHGPPGGRWWSFHISMFLTRVVGQDAGDAGGSFCNHEEEKFTTSRGNKIHWISGIPRTGRIANSWMLNYRVF